MAEAVTAQMERLARDATFSDWREVGELGLDVDMLRDAIATKIMPRVRVLTAVAEGASHRAVAEQFGVSAASVSRWRALARTQGEPRSDALGGDRRSARIEARAR